MQTFALFEDETSAQVLCDFFATDPGDDPVRLVFPDLEDTRLRHSAANGCLAAYQILSQRGVIDAGEHFCLSFQFAEHWRFANSHGSSAGLAFALKFAGAIFTAKTGKPLGLSVAATGAISDGTRTARVEAVSACVDKVRAALSRLSAGDLVFFPAENGPSLPSDLLRLADYRRIRLVPVATLAEALQTLLPETAVRRYRGQARRVFAGLSLVALLGLVAWAVGNSGHRVAAGMADKLQTAVRPEPLVATATFHFRSLFGSGNRPLEQFGDRYPPLRLFSGDLYKFSVSASDSCFLYLFQADSRGQIERWPDPLPQAGPLVLGPGQAAQVPARVEEWLILDEQVGEEAFTLLALRTVDAVLDSLYAQFRDAPEARKPRLRSELFAAIQEKSEQLPESDFALLRFAVRHEATPSAADPAEKVHLEVVFPIALAAARDAERRLRIFDDPSLPPRIQDLQGNFPYLPVWSPDGKAIAFAADAGGNLDIMVLDLADGKVRNLTKHPAEDREPAWSPDGQFVAFTTNRNKVDPDDFDLYRIRVEGAEMAPVDTSADRASQPAWSPDGRRIAYTRSTTFDDHRLWLAAPDGSEQKPLLPAIMPVNATAPAWSPDGTRIYFTGTVPGRPSRVGALDSEGGGLLLLGPEREETAPRPSPDGCSVLVRRALGHDLYQPVILDLEGDLRVRHKLPPLRVDASPPAYSWGEGFRHLGCAALGTSVSRILRLANRGDTMVEVQGVVFDDPQFTAGKQQFVVAPGEVRPITLVFTPQRAGTSYSTLSITTDDARCTGIRLILNGTGVATPKGDLPARLDGGGHQI